MSHPPSSDPNQEINIADSSVEGQIGQAGRDLTQIQTNVTFNQTQIIQIAIAEIKTRPLVTASPYRGLKSFELHDKDYFFGRDQFLTGLVHELESANLILLLGASGSGKSSVVQAGLIPWLAQQYPTRLVTPIFTPDQDPFESFYASLLNQRYKQAEVQRLREGTAEALLQTVQILKRPDTYWLILIDQFEEIFTPRQGNRRDAFIEGLVQLSRMNDPSLKIMMTMRADFLDRLSPYPDFAQQIGNHLPFMTEMQRDELRLAIEQPAAHHGVVFEEGLVEEIIKEVQGQAGYLPLLQYTLNLLWETEIQVDGLQDRTLNVSTYRQLGGIRGALQTHVNKIYNRFSPPEQLATQRIFLKLVAIGGDEDSETDWKPIRRRENRKVFSDELEQQILMQLIDQKLLVSDRQPSTQQSTIELAHEVLLTSWATLNQWIQENRQAIALRNRLNDDVARWQARQGEDELWGGSKLEQALELQHNEIFNQVLGGFSQEANQFLDLSANQRDRQQKAEQARQQHELKMARRVSRLAIATTGLAIVGLITGSFAFWRQSQDAKTIEAVLLESNPEIAFQALPNFLSQAENLRKRIDILPSSAKQQELISHYHNASYHEQFNRLFAYYRRTLLISYRLQQGSEKKQISPSARDAEARLSSIILKYRMPELEISLQQAKLGDGKEIENPYISQAIKLTKDILESQSGVGADFNENGSIDGEIEADIIPCAIINKIDELWRKHSQEKCRWIPKKDDDYAPNNSCEVPLNSLLVSIFDTDQAPLKRIKICQGYAKVQVSSHSIKLFP